MNLDLSILLDNTNKVYPFHSEIVNYDLNDNIEGFKIFGPIKYKGEIFKLEGSHMINMDIWYTYESKCDRCLKPITKEIKTFLSAKLEDYNEHYKKDEKDEYEDTIYHNKGLLKLDDYILMEVASSLPMKSLCNENCKGLCPQCGIDLNKESCNCVDHLIDPRLEKLKDFVIDD